MKGLTKEQFIEWAHNTGWKEDKYGHLQKTVGEEHYRFKIGKYSVRHEKKIQFADGKSEWQKLFSRYFKNLGIIPNVKGTWSDTLIDVW